MSKGLVATLAFRLALSAACAALAAGPSFLVPNFFIMTANIIADRHGTEIPKAKHKVSDRKDPQTPEIQKTGLAAHLKRLALLAWIVTAFFGLLITIAGFAALVSAVIAFLPALMAGSVLAVLGRHAAICRSWVFWALVGGFSGLAFPLNGVNLVPHRGADPIPDVTHLLSYACAGLGAALAFRYVFYAMSVHRRSA